MLAGSFHARRTDRRRGAAAPWIIMMLPVLAAAMALAVEYASLSHRQVQLQNAADAAALAAANAEAPATLLDGPDLVHDLLLTDRADRQNKVILDVRRAALAYAGRNPFPGGDVPLNANVTNAADGELLLGTLDGPNAVPNWMIPPLTADSLYNPHLNAVRVQLERLSVRAAATAYVDRDVIGFKVRGTSHVLTPLGEAAIPVVPLAVRTDWQDLSNNKSWDHNIIERQGADDYLLDAFGVPVHVPDPDPMTPTPADGIPEITVRISDDGLGNGQMVAVGADVPVALTQVTTGITATQLALFDPQNQLVLDQGGVNRKELNQLVPTSTQLSTLATELGKILGKRRVWLLYDTTPGGKVNAVGFVAARVMAVKTESALGVTTTEVVLQPTMLLTATALTDRSKRALGPRKVARSNETDDLTIFNPYIARVRLLK